MNYRVSITAVPPHLYHPSGSRQASVPGADVPVAAVDHFLRILRHLFFVLVCQATLAAVVAVEVRRHENTSTAGLVRALPPQASDLAIVIHPVELQRRERVLLVLVRDLLRLGVVL